MAGYILEFRDETEKKEVLEKLYKAKDEICAAIECLEDADQEEEGQMQERRRRMNRRDGMSRGMGYRAGRMRDERMMPEDEMEYRRGRYY